MADIAQLERALINADAAGDVEAAKTLAGEIKRMRYVDSAKAPEQGFGEKLSTVLGLLPRL